jgi:hypothetical protein
VFDAHHKPLLVLIGILWKLEHLIDTWVLEETLKIRHGVHKGWHNGWKGTRGKTQSTTEVTANLIKSM